MLRNLKGALPAVGCLLAHQPAVAQHLPAAQGEEARLWIATSDRISGVGLSTGTLLFEEANPASVISMAVDPQGGALWILRQESFSKLDLLALGRTDLVASVSILTPNAPLFLSAVDSGVVVTGSGQVEVLSTSGELKENRLEESSTSQLSLLAEEGCIDPIEGARFAKTGAGLQWTRADEASSEAAIDLSDARWVQCDAFGGAWAASLHQVVGVSRIGEISVDFEIPARFGEIRPIRSDPRDGALWIGARHRVLRLGLDGSAQPLHSRSSNRSLASRGAIAYRQPEEDSFYANCRAARASRSPWRTRQ